MLDLYTSGISSCTKNMFDMAKDIKEFLDSDDYREAESDYTEVESLKKKLSEIKKAMQVLELQLPELEKKTNENVLKKSHELKHGKKLAIIKVEKVTRRFDRKNKVFIEISLEVKTQSDITIALDGKKLEWNERGQKENYIKYYEKMALNAGVQEENIEVLLGL